MFAVENKHNIITMKKINLLVAFVLVAGGAFAQTWTLDKAHAKLGFGITHLMVSDVEGSFKTIDATLTSSKEDFSDAVIEFKGDAASVSTDNEQRDGHLKGPDFFEVEKFNSLTFKSTSVKKVEGKKYKIIGDLTLHGITKQVVLDAVINGPIVHPMNKKTIAGLKITGTIKRSDFGIGSKYPGAVLSDEVVLNANGEFVKG
jgi:polyisoprenoid-binding protein YceI